MRYEILKEKLHRKDNTIYFLKWATVYNELDGTKITDMKDEDFCNIFPFADLKDKSNKKFKNLKNTEFALTWFKNNKFKEENNIKYFEVKDKDYKKAKKLNSLPNINKLILYSFILQAQIKLISPYFSHDDDNFYLIQNPCLKEKVFKVPMIRGSGWKGAIARAGKEVINDLINKNSDSVEFKDSKLREYISSYLRLFGTGSDDFRKLEQMLIDHIKKDKNLDKTKMIQFFLFELGFKLTSEDFNNWDNEKKIKDWIKKRLWDEFGKNNKLPVYLRTHKGRAIFYPTYFDKLSLEIINPHNRKTRAGTIPIHYEVVQKGTEGILQIVYIPFDTILEKDNCVKQQIEQDIKFLTKCIEKVAEIGIGAKEKLGWGRFEFVKKENKEIKKVICNRDEVPIPEGWKDE